MADFLEQMRHKKNKDKRSFALLFTTLVTGGIFIIWLATVVATWDSRFKDAQLIPDEVLEGITQVNSATVLEAESPFDIEWETPADTVATTTATTTAEVAE